MNGPQQIDTNAPIGIFDSGIGGLTVLKAIAHSLPQENFIYFGDTARVPYGDKSQSTILRYSLENAMFLMDLGVKLLVIACNTAAAYSSAKVRQFFKIPIVDVIEAGVAQALQVTTHQRIAILATRATVRSEVYQQALRVAMPGAFITAISCPLFVPLVEEQLLGHEATRLLVKEYLAPLKELNIDTVLLGCTHYPLLAHLIQEELGQGVIIVDSATACAKQVKLLLQQHCSIVATGNSNSNHRFYVSDDPYKFQQQAERFLDWKIATVERADSGVHH
jgi:glutamate racemase